MTRLANLYGHCGTIFIRDGLLQISIYELEPEVIPGLEALNDSIRATGVFVDANGIERQAALDALPEFAQVVESLTKGHVKVFATVGMPK